MRFSFPTQLVLRWAGWRSGRRVDPYKDCKGLLTFDPCALAHAIPFLEEFSGLGFFTPGSNPIVGWFLRSYTRPLFLGSYWLNDREDLAPLETVLGPLAPLGTVDGQVMFVVDLQGRVLAIDEELELDDQHAHPVCLVGSTTDGALELLCRRGPAAFQLVGSVPAWRG